MKKLLTCTIVFLAIMQCSVCAVAGSEAVYTSQAPSLPFTSNQYEVSLFSYGDSFADTVTNAWDNLKTVVDVSRYKIPGSKVGEVYWDLYFNEPTYYYLYGRFEYSVSKTTGYVTKIYPMYAVTDREEINQYLQELDAATREILMYINDNMTDFEKVMAVHDYMALNYEYDLTYENHSITIMTTKTGVCQAYAYAFKHLMNELDIECAYVSSDEMNHGWNLVQLDGEWYHIDVTWDDPTEDKFGQVRHTYALLSTERISSLDNPHYDFDLGSRTADSNKYDDAPWHSSVASIVHLDGKTYWFDGTALVSSDGDVVCKNIAPNGLWSIGTGYVRNIYPGLAEYNSKLYYNSSTQIYVYNPADDTTEILMNSNGICGLYIDKNTLLYTVAEVYTGDGGRQYVRYVKGGSIELGDIRLGESYRHGDSIITRICNTSGSPVIAMAYNGTKAERQLFEGDGVFTADFDMQGTANIFVWDANLKPLVPKRTVE